MPPDTQASVLMIDVDFFKNVNDTYGHFAGDEVIRCVAHTLAQSVRQSHFVARFGGEEFVAFLQGSDVAGAEILAEKFRVAIASQDIPTSDGIVKVTVSVGLSETTAAQTVFAAVNDADSALLLAKQRGRTRVVVANSVLEKRATAGAALLAS